MAVYGSCFSPKRRLVFLPYPVQDSYFRGDRLKDVQSAEEIAEKKIQSVEKIGDEKKSPIATGIMSR